MKPVGLMAAVSVGSWIIAAAVVDQRTSFDVLFGMLGPLLAACVSWALIERAHNRNPVDVTAVMVGSFFAKMLFFGVYVAVMLRVVAVNPRPFVVSFTCYFIGLYLMDFVFLRRLFSRRSN
jgi:hypothetical protein